MFWTGAVRIGKLARIYPVSSEHIIDEREQPFVVRSINGFVLDPSGAVMEDVIVEIRDQQGRVRGAITNSRGRFKLTGVPQGRYKLKVTRDGFQSIVSDVVLSNDAPRKNKLALTMRIGV